MQVASVLGSRWSPSCGRKGHLTTLGSGGSGSHISWLCPTLILVPRINTEPKERAWLAQGVLSPSCLHRPVWFSWRLHPNEASPGGPRRSPAWCLWAPGSGHAFLEQRDRERNGQKTPLPLPLPLSRCASPLPPSPSTSSRQDPEKQVPGLLPPQPPTPKKRVSVSDISCIKHDAFLRHELAALWLPLP